MPKLTWTQDGNVSRAHGPAGYYSVRPHIGDYETDYPLIFTSTDGTPESVGAPYPSLEDAKSHAEAHAYPDD